MYKVSATDLGDYRGDAYKLCTFAEPEPENREEYDPDVDAEDYGVVLFRVGAGPLDENDQIVRMDTRHGRPHMDRAYLPPESSKKTKIYLEDGYTCERMRRFLLANWKEFVDMERKYNG